MQQNAHSAFAYYMCNLLKSHINYFLHIRSMCICHTCRARKEESPFSIWSWQNSQLFTTRDWGSWHQRCTTTSSLPQARCPAFPFGLLSEQPSPGLGIQEWMSNAGSRSWTTRDHQTDRPSAAARLMRHLSTTPELDPAPRWLVSRSFFPLWATELWIGGKRNWKQVLEAEMYFKSAAFLWRQASYSHAVPRNGDAETYQTL